MATRKQLGQADYIKCNGCKRVYATGLVKSNNEYKEISLVSRTSRTWSPYCCGSDFNIATEKETSDFNKYLQELRRGCK